MGDHAVLNGSRIPVWMQVVGLLLAGGVLGGGGTAAAVRGSAPNLDSVKGDLKVLAENQTELLSEMRHVGKRVGAQEGRIDNLSAKYQRHEVEAARRDGATTREMVDVSRRVERLEREVERVGKRK